MTNRQELYLSEVRFTYPLHEVSPRSRARPPGGRARAGHDVSAYRAVERPTPSPVSPDQASRPPSAAAPSEASTSAWSTEELPRVCQRTPSREVHSTVRPSASSDVAPGASTTVTSPDARSSATACRRSP